MFTCVDRSATDWLVLERSVTVFRVPWNPLATTSLEHYQPGIRPDEDDQMTALIVRHETEYPFGEAGLVLLCFSFVLFFFYVGRGFTDFFSQLYFMERDESV